MEKEEETHTVFVVIVQISHSHSVWTVHDHRGQCIAFVSRTGTENMVQLMAVWDTRGPWARSKTSVRDLLK